MELIRLLESHRGRDKIVRLATYTCMLLGGNGTAKFHRRMQTLVTELANCRTILRLFDDLPMLASNYMYGTGSREKNTLIRICKLITNVSYQIFFPVEHIGWYANKGVLSGFSAPKWQVAAVSLWAIALSADIIRCIAHITSLKGKLKELKKHQSLSEGESTGENDINLDSIKEECSKLKKEKQEVYLTLIQNCADFMNAINWMPPGVLWAGQFSMSSSGIFGLISSAMMLIKVWPQNEKSKPL